MLGYLTHLRSFWTFLFFWFFTKVIAFVSYCLSKSDMIFFLVILWCIFMHLRPFWIYFFGGIFFMKVLARVVVLRHVFHKPKYDDFWSFLYELHTWLHILDHYNFLTFSFDCFNWTKNIHMTEFLFVILFPSGFKCPCQVWKPELSAKASLDRKQ